MRPVIGAVEHDGVVGDAKLIELGEDRAHVAVVIDHHVVVFALPAAGLANAAWLFVRAEVHVGEVDPGKHRLARLHLPVDEVGTARGDVIVDRPHPLDRQRPGILDPLPADGAEARVHGGIIDFGGPGMQHAARAELRPERRVLRIVALFRLLLGVQVVQIAVEFVEAVHGRQELVAVAEVVLAELAGRVAKRFEQFGDGRVLFLEPDLGAGQPDLGQPGAEHALPGDEGGAAGGATLLTVVVGEQHALMGDPVDVGRLVAHHPLRVGADIGQADVVTPDDDDVRLAGGGRLRLRIGRLRAYQNHCQGHAKHQPVNSTGRSVVRHVVAILLVYVR